MRRNSNNFNVLRLILASMVMLVHIGGLTQHPKLIWMNRFFSGAMAVQMFFIVSGFLMLASWKNSKGLLDFAKKRIWRIYPAYIVAIIIGACISLALTSLPVSGLLSSKEFWKYLSANILFFNFIQQTLPGVFDENYSNVINGALWTLKIEVCFYIFVPIFAICARKFGFNRILAASFFLGCVYQIFFAYMHKASGMPIFDLLGKQLPGQLPYFCAGMLLSQIHASREAGMRINFIAFGTGLTLISLGYYVVAGNIFAEAILRPLVLAGGVYIFAFLFPRIWGATDRVDISYGVYVYHFPIVQAAVALGLYQAAPVAMAVVTIAVVYLISWASWVFVESPLIKRAKFWPAGLGALRTSP